MGCGKSFHMNLAVCFNNGGDSIDESSKADSFLFFKLNFP
jgi:hypothetical protein